MIQKCETLIEINNFDYLKRQSKNLRVYINESEIYSLWKTIKKEDYFKNFFSFGKFFFFISSNKMNGLKILFPSRKNQYERLKKIIKIQKIFYENKVSFDCEDTILEFSIKEMDSGEQRFFIGYITNTDIDFRYIRKKYILKEPVENILKVCKENNIDRWNLHVELLKRKNYILTKNGYKLIDIDPKFYFTNETTKKSTQG